MNRFLCQAVPIMMGLLVGSGDAFAGAKAPGATARYAAVQSDANADGLGNRRVRYIGEDEFRLGLARGAAFQKTVTEDLDVWTSKATPFLGRRGEYFAFSCSPAGRFGRLWGTNRYSHPSSICTAAVHAGLITFESGGTVAIEMRPEPTEYQYLASSQFGIFSSAQPATGSDLFIFVVPVDVVSGEVARIHPAEAGERAAADAEDRPPAGVTAARPDTSAVSLRGQSGLRFTFRCQAGQPLSESVWGTDVYSDDSKICSAAVHAGVMTSSAGGTVTIEIRDGVQSGSGSPRNGVESGSFWNAAGTFVFVHAEGK
jgi:hypothetical protein